MQLVNLVVEEKETKNGKATSRLEERQIDTNCTKKRSKTSIHESIVVLIDILTIIVEICYEISSLIAICHHMVQSNVIG